MEFLRSLFGGSGPDDLKSIIDKDQARVEKRMAEVQAAHAWLKDNVDQKKLHELLDHAGYRFNGVEIDKLPSSFTRFRDRSGLALKIGEKYLGGENANHATLALALNSQEGEKYDLVIGHKYLTPRSMFHYVYTSYVSASMSLTSEPRFSEVEDMLKRRCRDVEVVPHKVSDIEFSYNEAVGDAIRKLR